MRLRLRSIASIEKITKAVQMEASAKLRRLEDRLKVARAFAEDLEGIWSIPEEPLSKDKDFLMCIVASDRGLCGSFNASLGREGKREMDKIVKASKSAKVVLIGSTTQAGMEREFREQMFTVFDQPFKPKIPPFRTALKLAEELCAISFDHGLLFYNHHKNAVQFDRINLPLAPAQKYIERQDQDIGEYELEGPQEILENYYQYQWAVSLWHILAETDCAQTAARMTAMQAASKSSGELLQALQLLYNRTRQSKITIELCEITGGMLALSKGDIAD